jgi:hypothetical protein
VKEMRLRGIDTMEAGNTFLPAFMADYNEMAPTRPSLPLYAMAKPSAGSMLRHQVGEETPSGRCARCATPNRGRSPCAGSPRGLSIPNSSTQADQQFAQEQFGRRFIVGQPERLFTLCGPP